MDKYYQPKIEELFVGYECEIWWNYNYLPENEWCKIKLWQGSTEDFDITDFLYRIKSDKVRTKYLTKEDIESLGWVALPDISPFTAKPYKWRKVEEVSFNNIRIYALEFYSGTEPIQIHLQTETGYININQYIYSGKCPSKNELKYLSKLLNIQ